ncbi:MAG: preprotein translocase subunit SecG [Clostridia bacterium]|nr:preprotein translocase subunit SecG [Clostridia bacterium]
MIGEVCLLAFPLYRRRGAARTCLAEQTRTAQKERKVIFVLALQIILLVLGVILTVAVLMQHGKSHGLSGTIAGGAETFFGKEQGNKLDKFFGRATSVVSILFVVCVLLVFVLQPGDYKPKYDNLGLSQIPTVEEVEEAENAANSANQ